MAYVPLKKKPINGGGVVSTTSTNTTTAPKPVAPAPKQGYGIGYGVTKPGQAKVGYTDKNAEIDRTMQVIKNRQAQGMDTTSQFFHYKNLTGNDYGATPSPVPPGTTPPGTTPTTPAFDMGQFTGMFDKYNEANTSRFSALEKMIQEMMNGQKYNQAQQGQQQASQQAVYDGTHQFTAPNRGANVGYTQNNDAMNQTLYKYLNGMWKGGF